MIRYDPIVEQWGEPIAEMSPCEEGEWVNAGVAQALYDAIRYVYESQGAQDFTTLTHAEFELMRKSLSLADCGDNG